MTKKYSHIIKQVPVDYYQKGVRNNILQRTWHSNKLREVTGLVPSPPQTILDIGCASGWFISQVSKKFPKAKCYGIDVYTEGIRYAKKMYPQIQFKIGDAHKIPYKTSTFDLVISTEVLEHLDNPKKALLEIKRVLKKGGVTIIELDSGNLLFSLIWYLWKKFSGKVWNDSHLHSFNIKKVEELLRSCGFKVLQKKKFNFGMAMVFLVKK